MPSFTLLRNAPKGRLQKLHFSPDADPTRLRLLALLAQEELTVTELTRITFPRGMLEGNGGKCDFASSTRRMLISS